MRKLSGAGFSRRTVILSALALTAATNASPRRKARILFVCQRGTVKSPIAREIMRDEARKRGVAVQVRSRGIDPAEGATPEVAAALVRDGIDVKREPLLALTRADAAWADLVVYFDPLPLAPGEGKLRDWRDTPSVNLNYAQAMAVMRGKIDALLGELKH